MKNMYPNVKGDWRENLTLLNSVAYNELCKSPSAVRLLKYLYFCNKWNEVGKNKKYWISLNNGEIVCSFEKLQEKGLIKSKQTYTNAVALLVTLGFVELTQMGGSRKPHMFKILLFPACKKHEQMWREYPDKNWNHKIPQKNPKLIGGEKTYLKNFVKPNGIGDKTSDKPNGVGSKTSHTLMDKAKNKQNKSNVQSNGVGSIIGDTICEDSEPMLVDRNGSTELYQMFSHDFTEDIEVEWIGTKKYHEDMNKIKWKKTKN